MKGKMNFLAGLILGALMVSGAGAAGAIGDALAAIRSEFPIYVNGEAVEAESYTIAGHHYFKLRDLGRLVGFGVDWDSRTASVHIDTDPQKTQPPAETAPDGPSDKDIRYIPKQGDRITCRDGYVYEIRDVSRYNNSMFAEEETGALPVQTCDWSLLPQPELPAPEARHWTSGGKEVLFLRNLYETRRMQYTLNNAIGANPATWQNGRPVNRADGSPLVDIRLSVPDDRNVPAIWPWRTSQLTEYFNSCPAGTYYLEAWDVFSNGIFQHTEYYFCDD